MYCKKCGSVLDNNATLCPNCGATVENNNTIPNMNSNSVNQNVIGVSNNSVNQVGVNQTEENAPSFSIKSRSYDVDNYDYPKEAIEKTKTAKAIYVVIGIICAIVLVGVIIFFINALTNRTSGALSEEESNSGSSTSEAAEKEEEKLSKNYTITDTRLLDGSVLLEINNKNSVPIDASITVTFLDANKNVVEVNNSSDVTIAANGVGYDNITFSQDKGIVSYKVTSSIKKSSVGTDYTKDVKIVSSRIVDDEVLLSYKSEAKDTIADMVIGVFFYDSNNKIIGYDDIFVVDSVKSGETLSNKGFVPTDSNSQTIKYAKFEAKVLYAFSM